MGWAFNIKRKISAALLLTAIFVLLFVKNMVDNNNVAMLGNSFSSVYEDRLLVESYIYRMSEHLFRKKIMIDSARSHAAVMAIRPKIERYNQAIRDILVAYEKTRLTDAEVHYFGKFKTNAEALMALEDDYFASVEAPVKERINRQFNEAFGNLDELSRIQITEGKILNERSQKIVAGSSLLTQFEIGILVAIGLMIIVLIFESSSVFTRSAAQKQSLN